MRNWHNGRSNTKLMIFYAELYKAKQRKDPKEYWLVAQRLLRLAEFQVASLNKVKPSWPYGGEEKDKLTLSKVVQLLEEVNEIAEAQGSQNIKFRRVYIPKKSKEELSKTNVRPLGVPSLAWRVYLRGLNGLLMYFYQDKVEAQFAYLPGRSTQKAWKELLQNLEKWDNVYEFDLTGFFDNVTHRGIRKAMKELEFPPKEIEMFMTLCRNIPELEENESEDLMTEPDRGVKFLPDGKPNPGFVESLWHSDYKEVGVPQGAAISCGLSLLANLHQAKGKDLPKGGKQLIIYYADDGIIFSNQPITPEQIDDPVYGLKVKLAKSGNIKVEGRWVKDSVKFVGLEWFPQGRFRSNTRNGSQLEIEDKHLAYSYAYGYWKGMVRGIARTWWKEEGRNKYQTITSEERQREWYKIIPLSYKGGIMLEPKSQRQMSIEIGAKGKFRGFKGYTVNLTDVYNVETQAYDCINWLRKREISSSLQESTEKEEEVTKQVVEYWNQPLETHLERVVSQLQEGKSYTEKLINWLNSPEISGNMLSRMYEGTWLQLKQELEPTQIAKYSWVRERLGLYLWQEREEMGWGVLTGKELSQMTRQEHIKYLEDRLDLDQEGIDNMEYKKENPNLELAYERSLKELGTVPRTKPNSKENFKTETEEQGQKCVRRRFIGLSPSNMTSFACHDLLRHRTSKGYYNGINEKEYSRSHNLSKVIKFELSPKLHSGAGSNEKLASLQVPHRMTEEKGKHSKQ
jgi:hypothetical protein